MITGRPAVISCGQVLVEEGPSVDAFTGTGLGQTPANACCGFGVVELVLQLLPGGGIYHDDRRLAVDGQDLRSPGFLMRAIIRAESRLNSVRGRMSLVMSMLSPEIASNSVRV